MSSPGGQLEPLQIAAEADRLTDADVGDLHGADVFSGLRPEGWEHEEHEPKHTCDQADDRTELPDCREPEVRP